MNAEKRKAYLAKLEAQLEEWDAQMALWKAKTNKIEARARVKYEKQLDALRAKRTAVRKNVQELRKASETAAETLTSGVERAWKELKTAGKKAAKQFTK